MRKKSGDSNGFGAIEALLIIVVLVAAAGVGVYAYHRSHKAKPAATANSGQHSNSNNGGSTTPTPAPKPDPYAGWKTYTDTQHHYSFRYPADWGLDSASAQTTLLNPAKTVQITYANPFVHDNGLATFTPSYIGKLTSANEDLTVVGGYNYSPNNGLAGDYTTTYHVVDSSLLTSYPLTVGSATQFYNNPGFTNKNPGSSQGPAVFFARAAITVNSAADAQSWLGGTDGQTSLKILQSLTYQQ